MADVFNTGQKVAKPLSALSQKGVENRLERLNADEIISPQDSSFAIEHDTDGVRFRTNETDIQQVEFQFKANLGGEEGLAFIGISTPWTGADSAVEVNVPSGYLTKDFQLIVSTRIVGSDKPPFVQQATIPAWPVKDETLTFNTCDND
jgi:hypothetical protein